MNPDIHSIAKDMQQYSPKDPIATSDIHTHLSIQMARLLALLAEESEKQTKKMICFTIAIFAFTGALFFIGIVQIIMMIVKP